MLRDFVEVLEDGATPFDAAIDADPDELPLLIDTDPESEGVLDARGYANQNPLSSDHRPLHLPKCKGCSLCDGGTVTKSISRRRKQLKATATAADALAGLFGAMVHLDHIAMEPRSEAAKAARYSLNMQDAQTCF